MKRYRLRLGRAAGFVVLAVGGLCCASAATQQREEALRRLPSGHVTSSVTVLLEDSIGLIAGKRIGLLTNQTGIDERGRSDIDLLSGDGRATRAHVALSVIFAPEHGIRGTEDREHLSDEVDAKTRVRIVSLYGAATLAPPDSILRRIDALVFDLQDIGTRTWTYEGALVYAMRASARTGKPIIVLDRPNPLGGFQSDGPMLDSTLANPNDPTPAKPGRAYAIASIPLRHGLTMGELASYYNRVLRLGAELHVIPMRGWQRDFWFDRTGLPWVRPSPNMPSLASAILYPALVPFEGTNVSVGRGTDIAFQRIGAPWLRNDSVVALLKRRGIGGVQFVAERFTPVHPGDQKFAGRSIPGVRIEIMDRNAVQTGRIGAALLWAIHLANPDSLRIDSLSFDLRFGSPSIRRAILRGEDPDALIDQTQPAVIAFRKAARADFLYH